MEELVNWRWYRKYSGGPIADLGSHQIDVFSWFLNAHPSKVLAAGGLDNFTQKQRDWYDNIMTIYEYETQQGGQAQRVRGFYQVLNTTSYGGFFETIMGEEGALMVSEDETKGFFFRETTSSRQQKWEDEAKKVEAMGREAIQLKVGESLRAKGADPQAQKLLAEIQKPVHQLHLENFFAAVRQNRKELLTCPPETGYATAVAVLSANRALEEAKAIMMKPEEFKV
jgi:predicted dehydrogenase